MSSLKHSPAQKMLALIDETKQLSQKAAQTGGIYTQKALEVEEKISLNKKDLAILFFGVVLHAVRIYIIQEFINDVTETSKAGENKGVEGKAKDKQKEIADNHQNDKDEKPSEYYAPLKQIYTCRGVPYDATAFDRDIYVSKSVQPKFFKGANHRFSTLGHDPILGLFFGTINIVTNTITVTERDEHGSNILYLHGLDTYHVRYDDSYRYPSIAGQASFVEAMIRVFDRCKMGNDGLEVIKAAVVKQIIHIASDIFTTDGIPLPLTMEVFDKKSVAEFTKYVSAGDIIKQGSFALLTWITNLILNCIHGIAYDSKKDGDRELYGIKTRTVVDMSNMIASGSNVIISLVRAYEEKNPIVLKNADFGGLYIAIRRILHSEELKTKIRNEYMVKGVINEVLGSDWVVGK